MRRGALLQCWGAGACGARSGLLARATWAVLEGQKRGGVAGCLLGEILQGSQHVAGASDGWMARSFHAESP